MKDKGEHYKTYGWTCSETNLNTLPDTAPEGAHKLSEWLTLQGRRTSLVEWLGQCRDDGRIHGRFMHIGAWTGRMSHQAPNQANIPSAFYGDPKTAVESVKHRYDGPMRKLWCVDDGNYLVGTDAEGIQLRILAHLMQSRAYVNAIVTGKKEDETDIHNVNKRALGIPHVTRDMAKTFIYAFLLGAGIPKIASILKVNRTQAQEAVNNFLESIDGLKELKKKKIPHIARRGYFTGLDGRKVKVPSEHKTLAGMLQNGESVVVKHWVLEWKTAAEKEGLDFKLIDIVHDEVQVEVPSMEIAERLIRIQKESMNRVRDKLDVFCPLAVSSDIGRNWYETH